MAIECEAAAGRTYNVGEEISERDAMQDLLGRQPLTGR
jgi:hypothetical protein